LTLNTFSSAYTLTHALPTSSITNRSRRSQKVDCHCGRVDAVGSVRRLLLRDLYMKATAAAALVVVVVVVGASACRVGGERVVA
jgi:hypothetical protein